MKTPWTFPNLGSAFTWRISSSKVYWKKEKDKRHKAKMDPYNPNVIKRVTKTMKRGNIEYFFHQFAFHLFF